MTKTAGRPKQQRARVTVSLEPHHAAELKLMADEAGVTLSAFCANILERYTLQDRQVMSSDILRTLFESQTVKMQEGIRTEINAQMNRVRHLLARSALESMATRNETSFLLQKQFGKEKGQEYHERAWNHAVHYLKEPTPAMRAALSELAAGMGNDDPGLLLKVRESADQVTQGLTQVQHLADQVTSLQRQQSEMVQAMTTMQQQSSTLATSVTKAVKDLRKAEQEWLDRPKSFF